MTPILNRPSNSSVDQPTASPRVSYRSNTVVILLMLGVAHVASAANWPGWRGPNGDGTTATAKNLPETWSTSQNIKWKQEMPAWSGSSPMVWGDKIFLNSPSKE